MPDAPLRPWYFRFARPIVYAGLGIAAVMVAAISVSDSLHDAGRALVEARQLYGLWTLALLLASLLIGPLTSVLPWLPFRSPLVYARRAVGICAMVFAALHVICYLAALIRRNWTEFWTPGVLWVLGLLLGLAALTIMTLLGLTSNDASVKRMGGRRWKRLHQTVYVLLGIVLIHALLNGADFGLAHAPDVTGQPDAGALFGFVTVAVAWLALFVLRRRAIRWTRAALRKSTQPSVPSGGV